MGKFKSKYFYYELSGDYALFTSPISKGGGEKFTYPIPTYQALKGITEQIYWKPTFIIFIDEIKIINKISTYSKGIRLLYGRGGKDSFDRSKYTYLSNVRYAIKYHYEWNSQRQDLIVDRDERKHSEIMERALSKGGRKDIFLGARECIGFAKQISENDYYSLESAYSDSSMSFGIMFHSFNYPSEVNSDYSKLQSNFAEISMEEGVIKFIRPSECPITMDLSEFSYNKIDKKKIKNVDEEYREYVEGGGEV